MKKRKLLLITVLLLLFSMVFAACGSTGNDAEKSGATATKEETQSSPKTIVIGTGNAFKPYCYIDEKGTLAGYEVEVLKEVNKRLPQYKFEFQSMDFTNILLSLQSNKVDIAAHQFEVNPERKEKYLFADESYTTFILRITVGKDRNDINSIKDLHGKTVQVSKGSNDAYVMEDYNKKNGNPIKLVYSASVDPVTTIKSIEDGRIDAFISIKRIVESYNKTYGDKLKTVGDPVASSSTYYIYRKEDTQLKSDIDTVLKALKSDGTLSKISIDTLGGDYTTND